ncbi:ornithine cyclodeaminase family protein [Pandoraea nosoerga]|nr:ornithine cyclodeaminase family protein [Pandoraea nosoerga]MBN4665839.1 ornithine cyclodeaminase family protein [Pandoraea nosoerga]MBN4677291.1 ornithine cyclodeaminase family protein [Pandoraea nosoerga]MBN4681152.1 ornithine cyclodeaminase family protein [Pandoraea nosoerga]MBN4746355.1 ornithine cyclodeaminase family protein [Pandoraea nosoerga]
MSATSPSPAVLVLDAAQVAALMPVADAIPVMSDMFAALARGQIHLPLRQIVRPPEALGAKGLLGMMPAFIGGGEPVYGAKVGTFFPGNSTLGKDPHQGCVVLMSGETGELLAIMNAAQITGIRTAAVTGLATRLLARHDATRLALIGAGHQAHWHLAALVAARPLRHVRVASRSLESAQRFVDAVQPHYDVTLEAAGSVQDAVRDADIVVTVTNATDPVLEAKWLAPGTHVNLVGSSTPRHREADTALMALGQLFVDRRESTINESGDYLAAAAEGRIGPEHLLAELGEIVVGAHPGRTDAASVTLFKSLGMGAQDVALAAALYQRAQDAGAGARVAI